MAKIKTLKDSEGNLFYPQTHTKGIVDDNGNNLEAIFSEQEKQLDNKIAEHSTVRFDRIEENETTINAGEIDSTPTAIVYYKPANIFVAADSTGNYWDTWDGMEAYMSGGKIIENKVYLCEKNSYIYSDYLISVSASNTEYIDDLEQGFILESPLKGLVYSSKNANALKDIVKFLYIEKDDPSIVLPKRIRMNYLRNAAGNYKTLMQFIDVNTKEVAFSWYTNDGPLNGLGLIRVQSPNINARIMVLVNWDKVYEENIEGCEFVVNNMNTKQVDVSRTVSELIQGGWDNITKFHANQYYSAANVSSTGKMVDYRQASEGTYCTRLNVKEGERYKIYGKGQSNVVRFYAITDRELNVLKTNNESINAKADGIELVMPEGAKYLYLNLRDYSSTTDRIFKYSLYNLENAKYRYNLYGKTIVCFGDSITQFTDHANCSYTDYIKRVTGANVYNVGIGGTQYRARVYPTASPSSSNEAWANVDIVSLVKAVANQNFEIPRAGANWLNANGTTAPLNIVNRLQSIDFNKVDIVTFFGGTNDWGSGGGYLGDEDSTNITYTLGAINSIVEMLLQAYPHLKIYIFTPIVRWGIATSDARTEENWCDVLKSGGYTLEEYVELIKKQFRKHKLPVCDMYHTLGWNKYNFNQFFTPSDGTHPILGLDTIGEKIAAKLFES